MTTGVDTSNRKEVEMPLHSGFKFTPYDLDEVYPGRTEVKLDLGDTSKLSGVPGDAEYCVEAVAFRSCGYAEWAIVGEQCVYLLHTPKQGTLAGQRICLRLEHTSQSKRSVKKFDATKRWEGDNRVVLKIIRWSELYRNKHLKNAKRREARAANREPSQRRSYKPRMTREGRALSGLIQGKRS